jgi:hypothetical protein
MRSTCWLAATQETPKLTRNGAHCASVSTTDGEGEAHLSRGERKLGPVSSAAAGVRLGGTAPGIPAPHHRP